MNWMIMEYSPDGADLVRKNGKVAVFNLRDAKRMQRYLTERTGYMYSVMPYDGNGKMAVELANAEVVW
jgi:hypothetical protein